MLNIKLLVGFFQCFKGKGGCFRVNLLGKCVEFIGRIVILFDFNLKIIEVIYYGRLFDCYFCVFILLM